MSPAETPSQTVGPFLSLGLAWPGGRYVVPQGTPGAVWIRGTVLDGAGTPVPDALVETWQQPASDVERDVPTGGMQGLGRCATDEQGGFAVLTVVPAGVAGQAPHLGVSVFARGLLDRVVTRIYFPEHADQHGADPALAAVPAPRRRTLVAVPAEEGYRFDIRLQGADETVFFDV